MISESRILRWGLIIAPFVFLSPGPAWLSHRLTVMVLAGALVVAFVPSLPIRILSWYVCGWVMWALVQRFVSTGDLPFISPLRTLLFVMVGVSVILAAVTTSSQYSTNTIRYVILAATATATITFVWGSPVEWVASRFASVSSRTFPSAWCSGGFGNPNFYAGAVAICFPYFLWRKWWVSLIPISLVLIGSRTFGASLAIVAAVSWIMYRRHVHLRWIFLVLLIGGVGAYLFDGEGVRGVLENERLGWWGTAWDGITSSPLTFVFGHGPSTYPPTPPLHNDYLTMWYQFGAVGLGILIWGIVSLWRIAYHTRHQASIVAYCIFMLTSRPMQMPLVSVLFLIIVGMILRAGCPGPREAAGSG